MKKYISLLSLSFILTIQAQWTQVGIDIVGEANGDQFGRSISISSDGIILAVGAPSNQGIGPFSGHVRVFENQNDLWVQVGQDIDAENPGDSSGFAVSLSADGSIVAIGSVQNNGNGNKRGHVRVFENQNDLWVQVGQDIDGEADLDRSGWSLSLSSDGSILAIGAHYNSGNGLSAGHVRIFENQSGIWTQLGNDIDGENINDRSGWSLSLSSDGSIVAIGSPANDDGGLNTGHVRVFEFQNDAWIKLGNNIVGENENDWSGNTVSLNSDGSIAAIGSLLNDDNGIDSGHVRIFKYDNDAWTQIGEDINGEFANDQSSVSISLNDNGSTVAIGAIGNDDGGFNAGHARIFQNQSDSWVQVGNDIDGVSINGNFGYALSLSSTGSTVAISAPHINGNGINPGLVRVFSNPTILSVHSIYETNVLIYPNPTYNILNIKSKSEITTIKIYNKLGQLILKNSTKNKIDISSLRQGLYFAKVEDINGNFDVKKIVKK